MENICLKFPHLFEQINKLLDNETLVKCKEASRTLYCAVENQRARKYQWIRIIQSYLQVSNEFKEHWRNVFAKMSAEHLEKFAKDVQKFCKIDRVRMTEHRWSPLHIAVEFSDLEFFKLFADMLSIKNLKDKDDWSLIHSATQAGNFEIYQFLVKSEPFENKNPRTKTGITPLHLAAKSGHLDIYKFISKQSGPWVNINPRMDCDITPLHLAAKYGQLKVCKFICDNLDNWNLRRSDLKTPFELALMKGHIKTAGMFISYGGMERHEQQILAIFAPIFFITCRLMQFEDPFPLQFHLNGLGTFVTYMMALLLMLQIFYNLNEVFRWNDPICGNEFENFCNWVKSFDQDVEIMANNLENVEIIEFD
jgi:hypothetical protein